MSLYNASKNFLKLQRNGCTFFLLSYTYNPTVKETVITSGICSVFFLHLLQHISCPSGLIICFNLKAVQPSTAIPFNLIYLPMTNFLFLFLMHE